MGTLWYIVKFLSFIILACSFIYFVSCIYCMYKYKNDKEKYNKHALISFGIIVIGLSLLTVAQVHQNKILAKMNKNSLELTQPDKDFHTNDNGYFTLKGKVIWPATIEISGTGKNKKMKSIKREVDAGKFSIKLPKANNDNDLNNYKIEADYDNGYYRQWTFKVENMSDDYLLADYYDDDDSESDVTDASKAATDAIVQSQSKNPADYQTGITYEQVARTPDDYEYKKVQFTGEVAQTLEDDNTTEIRLAVNGNYDNMMLVDIDKDVLNGKRILENDQVTVSGLSIGVTTYESTMGQDVTIPQMEAIIVTNNSAQ